MFAISTYAGVAAYLRLVSNYSGVTAVVVTTSRKVVTVTLSFLLFPKSVGWGHVASGLIVILGVIAHEIARRMEKKA